MKKIVASLFLIVSTVSFAQQGSWYVGGNVGFSTRTIEEGSTEVQKSSSWAFSPEVGTFLTNNIQLGVGFTTTGNSTEYAVTKTTSTTFGGTLYGRYFFGENTFKPFVGLNISVLPGNTVTENKLLNTSTESDFFQFGTNLNAGFGYALSEKITAVGSFGFLGYESRTQGNSTDTNLGFNFNTLGNRFTIGFYYTL